MPRVPDGLPLLGRGRHRSPRDGACVMEYTSVLAGERWSDNPSCVHPALATLARMVNDCTADEARQSLVTVVPDLVHSAGLRGKRARLGQRIARKAVLAALPLATGLRRRTLCAALLGAEKACGPSRVAHDPDREAVRALLRDPDEAMLLAIRLSAKAPRPLAYDRKGVTKSLELAVMTIAESGHPRADDVMRRLLVDCTALVRGVPAAVPAGTAPGAVAREERRALRA